MDIVITPQERERTHTFLGKTVGDLTVPHVAKGAVSSTMPSPANSGWNEVGGYTSLSVIDGSTARTASGASNIRGNHLFAFDLSDTLGGSLDRIRNHTKLHGVWWGKAQGVNGEAVNYESEVYAWNRTTSRYDKVGEGGARFERNSVALNPDTGVEEVANQPRYVGGNYSLRFDGNSYVDTGMRLQDLGIRDSVSIALRVKSDASGFFDSNGQGLVGVQQGNNRLYVVLHRNRQIYVGLANSALKPTGAYILADTWHDVLVTADQGIWKVFVDGEEVSNGTYDGSWEDVTFTHTLRIGDIPGASAVAKYVGLQDDVRIWNTAVTPETADSITPIAHWHFDEGQGTTAHDTAERINLLPPNVANGGEDGTTEGVRGGVHIESTSEDCWQGERSFKINRPDGSGTTLIVENVPFEVGKTYTLTFWFKATEGVPIRVGFADRPYSGVLGSGEWRSYTTTHTIGAIEGTTFGNEIHIGFSTSVQGDQVAYIDGLQLQEGDVATPWTPPKLQPYDGTIEGAEYSQDNPFFEQGGYGNGLLVEEGTTNIIPLARQKFENGVKVGGAEVTVLQGQDIPGVTQGGASRITTSGGNEAKKYYIEGSPPSDVGVYSWSVWIHNTGSTALVVSTDTGLMPIEERERTVLPGEVKHLVWTYNDTGNHFNRIAFATLPGDEDKALDFVAYQPQIEAKPYPTSFTTGTRAPESLRIPTAGVLNAERGQVDIDVAVSLTPSEYKQVFNTLDSNGPRRFNLQFNRAKQLEFWYWTGSSTSRRPTSYTLMDELPHRYTLKWAGNSITVFVDGVSVGTFTEESYGATGEIRLGRGSTLMVGWRKYYGFRVMTEPMSDADIAAEYGKPLTANVHTTCLIDFNRNLASIMPVPFTLSNAGDYVDDDGKVHILTRPKYPSDGTTPAEVATDYVELRSRQEYVSRPRITNKGRNLIVNPGFEQLDSNGWPVGWLSNNHARLESTDTYAGNYALRLSGGSSGAAMSLRDDIPVTPGKWYLYSAWLKQTKGTSARLRIQWVDVQGNTMPAIIKGVTPPKDRFERFEYLVQVPNGIVAARVTPSMPGGAEAIFDNLQFEQVDGPDSLPTEYTDAPAQVVEIDTDLVAGDVLRIDSDERKVWKNGEEVGPELVRVVGGWPKFTSGKNTITVEDELNSLMFVRITWQEDVAHLFDEVDVSAEQQLVSDAIDSTTPLTLYTSSSLEGVEWILQWSNDGVRWFDDKVLIDEGTSRIRVIEPKARKVRLVARNTTDATITVSAFVEAKGDE